MGCLGRLIGWVIKILLIAVVFWLIAHYGVSFIMLFFTGPLSIIGLIVGIVLIFILGESFG